MSHLNLLSLHSVSVLLKFLRQPVMDVFCSTSMLRSKKSSSLLVTVSQLRQRVSLVRMPWKMSLIQVWADADEDEDWLPPSDVAEETELTELPRPAPTPRLTPKWWWSPPDEALFALAEEEEELLLPDLSADDVSLPLLEFCCWFRSAI